MVTQAVMFNNYPYPLEPKRKSIQEEADEACKGLIGSKPIFDLNETGDKAKHTSDPEKYMKSIEASITAGHWQKDRLSGQDRARQGFELELRIPL